ncbi:MAG: caspase family protein, partial [Acidobacteriota bacterium]
TAIAVGAALLILTAWLVLRSPSPGVEDAALVASLNFGKYQAVVIGNNAYEHLEQLQTAVPDAKALASVLEGQYGFEVERLENVTRHDLVRALELKARATRPEDHLLVYYAGHGRLEEPNDRAYWQPVDADPANTSNWISSLEVSDVLLDAKARHVLVVADSCYSGAMATALPEDAGPTGSAADRRSWFESRLGKHGRLVLTSGGVDPVPDGGSAGHSIFARRLLDVLRENRGILRGRQLYDLVTQGLEGQGRPGLVAKPSFGALKTAGDEGGEFFFVPRSLRRVSS